MKRETITRIICTVIAALLMIGSVPKVRAEEEKTYAFDKISIEKDLDSIDGFNYIKYPYDPTGFHSPQIFNVAEWAYSFRAEQRGDYALYIYFYNPQGLDIDENSMQNKIVLAVDYDKYPITQDSLPTSYETFDLAFCSKTGGNYANLFYKYRVIDHESADGKTIAERVNSNGRRYDISEILLRTRGADNATAYGVGGSYYFTGYAAGYGADTNAASTLTCEVVDLETVELEVESTYFRTQSSSAGAYHQNQLNSVYFGIPNELLNKYGSLQKVKAEWYEYETKPIYVTTVKTAEESFKQHIGEVVGENYNESIGYGMGFGYEVHSTDITTFSYADAFNVYKSNSILSPDIIYNYIDSINYIFYAAKLTSGKTAVTAEQLKDYIFNYGAEGSQLPIKNGTVSADLFVEGLKPDREAVPYVGNDKHYKRVEIDAGDKFDMLSYDETNNFWDKLFDYGLFAPETDDTYKNIPPFYAVTSSDLLKIDETLSAELFIDANDISDFKEYAAAAALKNETTHLFRFAQTDYYSEMGRTTTKNSFSGTKDSAMRAQETVFFDFMIISLTFNKEGVYQVIPAVSSPIDVIADINPPPEESFWLLDAIKDFLNSLGAWGMLIISIIIGCVILIIELKILQGVGSIKNTVIRIILMLALLALFVWLDYMAVNYAITVINGLGGLI